MIPKFRDLKGGHLAAFAYLAACLAALATVFAAFAVS
jgi:hypothetical protein